MRTQRAAFRDAMSNVYNNNYVNQKMNEFDNAVKDGTLSKFLNDTRADLDPMTVKNSEYAKPKLNTEVAANQSLNMVNDVDEGMMTYIATQPYIDNAKTNLDGGFQRILNAMKDDESRTFVVETGILADNRYMVWDKGKWQWKHRTWRTPLETFYTDEAAIDFLQNYFQENPEDIADSFVDNYGEANTILGNFFYKLGDAVDNFQYYTFRS